MPGDIINLRRWRRRAKRAEEQAAADANATRHGLPRSVTNLADARRAKSERDLEAHRLEPQEPADDDDPRH